MPEISGTGQRKLLESAVKVYGETVNDIYFLIYYLAACGIGNIYCCLKNNSNFDALVKNIKDYNPDILLELYCVNELENKKANLRIMFGNINVINDVAYSYTLSNNENDFIPTIIACVNQWKGILKYFDKYENLKNFIFIVQNKLYECLSKGDKKLLNKNCGNIICESILGTLCASEFVKLCLNIDEIKEDNLFMDIFSMQFDKMENDKIVSYIEEICTCDNDSINYEDINKKLYKSKVLIIGAGGLGSPAAYALAMAGVGTIGLVDNDLVELSNLNRQILHSTSRIGMAKVESAKIFLENLNPQIKIHTYMTDFNIKNAVEIISKYDVVIAAVDNIQTRYLINDACFFSNKPLVEAGVLRFNGTNTTIIPKVGHCYRCLFQNLNSGNGLACGETGVLGSVPGTMGFIQASEAIKIIAGIGETLKSKILIYDAIDFGFVSVNLEKNTNCCLCGENPTIKSLQADNI